MARVLHLVGSPTSAFMDDLSRLYAADCLANVGDEHEHVVAHVSPDGSWRFPTSLEDLADAYLHPRDTPLEPLPTSRPTYWTYHELWRALSSPRTAAERWRVVREGKEAVFDRADPLPHLVLHHVQIPLLLWKNLLRGKDWVRIDFNIGKLVMPAGD